MGSTGLPVNQLDGKLVENVQISVSLERIEPNEQKIESAVAKLKKLKKIKKKSNRDRHACPMCQRAFYYKYNLNIHLRKHTGEKPCKCSTCGKEFVQKIGLIRHKKIHGDGSAKKFPCKFCNRRFITKSALEIHIRSHTGEKPFKCSFWEKAFTSKLSLNTHMRFHTGEKPYSCSICSKRFPRKCNLKDHVRVHTSAEKTKKCLECGKFFSTNFELKIHLRTQLGEKPYSCQLCSKPLCTLEGLNIHIR